jgi:hypothetical protein
MSEPYVVENMTIEIGGVIPFKSGEYTASDFSSVTWVEIDGWKTAGGIVDTSEVTTIALINRAYSVKKTHGKDAADAEMGFMELSDDAGQIDLKEAADSANRSKRYAFRVKFNNLMPEGVGATPPMILMAAQVSSFGRPMGDRGAEGLITATLVRDNNAVYVAGVEGT